MLVHLQEQRLLGVKDPQTSGAPSTAQGGNQGVEEDNDQDLLCVCQQPYNVDTAMISCDVCEDWYHLRCVGMTQAAAKSMKKYTCPVCLALKGNSDPLQAALAKVSSSCTTLTGNLCSFSSIASIRHKHGCLAMSIIAMSETSM